MMKKLLLAGAAIALLQACGETTPLESNDTNNFNSAPVTGSGPQYGGDVYYTGYDGTGAFALFLPTSRQIEVVDNSVAIAQEVQADITTTEATAMVDDYIVQTGETLSANRRQRMIDRLVSAKYTRVTPLKPGVTLLKATRIRNGQVRWESDWQKAEYRTLVVNDYRGINLSSGQLRYENGGADSFSNPACKSCHTGEANASNGFIAPPHQIGGVIEVDDANLLSWLKSGQALDRTAPISHSWSFSGAAEEKAVIAYVRQLQVKDATALRKLIFQAHLEADKLENAQ